jgi:YVTN family beta-propeller protein
LATISTGLADKNGEMSLSAGDGAVWLLSDSAGILVRINPTTNSIEKKIMVKPHSYCTAYGFGAIWITNHRDNSVQKIDPATNTVTATIAVGAKPRFLTVGEHGVWTLNQGDGTVSKIDPLLNKTVGTINVKAVGNGGDITSGGGKIWIVSTNVERPVQIINPTTDRVETIYSQNPVAGKTLKVDGAARSSNNYVWVSGYYSKTVWVFKK